MILLYRYYELCWRWKVDLELNSDVYKIQVLTES